MSTVLMKRGDNAEMLNTPRIDGLVFYNSDDNCIYLDDGDSTHERVIYGGKMPTLTDILPSDGASNNNIYTALAIKNGTCLKSNVADTSDNINNTTNNGRPVGCVGFKSIIGTDDISMVGSNVKNSIAKLGNRLVINNNKFVFDYQNGRWGFNTSEERGADTFHPFNSTALSMSNYQFNSVDGDYPNNDVLVTNVRLDIATSVDVASTALPIAIANGTSAVTTTTNGAYVASLSKYVNGGIIHVFDDLKFGTSGGTHNHYMYLGGAWRVNTNKSPLSFPENANAAVGFPFVIPTMYSSYENTRYSRNDELYYVVCCENKARVYKYTVSNGYDYGTWFRDDDGSDYELLNQIGQNANIGFDYINSVVYHGKLHIFTSLYFDDGVNISQEGHYIYDTEKREWSRDDSMNSFFANKAMLGTVVHNDKVYIFYYDLQMSDNLNYAYRFITYSNGIWSDPHILYKFNTDIDIGYVYSSTGGGRFVEYNGEIHILGGNGAHTQHKSLNDSEMENYPSTLYYKTYTQLKYPFTGGMVCVVPKQIVYSQGTEQYYANYMDATFLNAPTYLHYMGTEQAASYRKNNYQFNNTYLASLYNYNNETFIQK